MNNNTAVAVKEPTMAELKARIAELEAITSKNNTAPSWVIGLQKGNVLIHGIGRFPISLYQSQVARLQTVLASKEFTDFIGKYGNVLSDKADGVQIQADKLAARTALAASKKEVCRETKALKNNEN